MTNEKDIKNEKIETIDAEAVQITAGSDEAARVMEAMQEKKNASITCYTKDEADQIVQCAAGIGVKSESKPEFDEKGNPAIVVTLLNVSDDQLSRIEKRIGFDKMKNAVIRISDKVTETFSDIGDFALNDALVPAVSAAGKAAMRTTSITAVAGARIAGSLTSSAINEASTAAFRLASDPVIHQAGRDLKFAGSTIKRGACSLFNYITGTAAGSTKFTRC